MGPAKFDLLISTGTFYPDIGGPATYIKQLASELTDQKITVNILTFGTAAEKQPYPVKYISRKLPLWLRLIFYFTHLYAQVLNSKSWYVNDYGFPAWLVSLLTGRQYTLKIVGDFAWEWSKRHLNYQKTIDDFQNRRPLIGKLVQLIQKTYARRAKKIIVPSLYLKKIVSGWGIADTKIEVIYNAVLTKEPNSQTLQELKKYPKPLLCTVARLVDWKGIDHVLKALSFFKAQSWQYLIVGTGPDLNRLAKLAKEYGLADRVYFLGNQSAEAVHALLSQSDLFLLLSSYEGLPHVVLEALSHQVPCIVSNSGGFGEVIEESKNGYLLDLKSSQFESNLKNLIERFLNQTDFIKKSQVLLPQKFQYQTMMTQTRAAIL